MKELTAVELRQSLGKVARSLEKDGKPILLKIGRRPVGVIVSLRDFHERFALEEAADARRKLVEEILGDRVEGAIAVDDAISDVRGR